MSTVSGHAITKHKWKLEKVRDLFLQSKEKYSDEFALNWDPSTKFALFFNSCEPMIGNFKPLGLVLKDFERNEPIEVAIKFWIESTKTTVLAQHIAPSTQFKAIGDKCGFALERGKEMRFFNACFEQNGCLYLGCELRYQIPGKQPSPRPVVNMEQAYDSFIKVEGSVGDVSIYKVVKKVMIEASPRFKELFEEADENTIKVNDVKPKVMRAVIEYICNGGTDQMNDLVEDLFVASELYTLPSLKKDCLISMCKEIDHENLFSRLVLGFMYDVSKLKLRAIEFATRKPHSKYLKPMLLSDEWISLSTKNKDMFEQMLDAIFAKMY